MFKANYHTHTKRCNHAWGEDEDYVEAAIESGFDTLGFSDHIMLPGLSQPHMRGEFSTCQDYYDSIRSLKEKYKDKIDIHLGFEAESIPDYFPYLSELLQNNIIEYLVLGNHFMMDSNKNVVKIFSRCNSAADIYDYLDYAEKALKTNMYTIFAHPDIFLSSIENFDNDCLKVSQKLIELAIKYDVYLELNMGGIRVGKKEIGNQVRYRYPTDFFFDLVEKYDVPCLIGVDAHDPSDLTNEDTFLDAANIAKRHHLKIIDHINFKHFNK